MEDVGDDVGSRGCEHLGHGDSLFIAAGGGKNRREMWREWSRALGTWRPLLIGMLPGAMDVWPSMPVATRGDWPRGRLRRVVRFSSSASGWRMKRPPNQRPTISKYRGSRAEFGAPCINYMTIQGDSDSGRAAFSAKVAISAVIMPIGAIW